MNIVNLENVCDKKKEEQLKSVPNNTKVLVRFINTTYVKVDIVWIDFEGTYRCYRTLPPRSYNGINTYQDHLWIAVNQRTGDKLWIENDFLYKSQERKKSNSENKDDRINIYIRLPLYSLRQVSFLVVRDRLKTELGVDQLEIPQFFKTELKEAIRKRNKGVTYEKAQISAT